MSANAASIGKNEPVSKARQLMEELSIHHLPVMNGEELVGIVTSNDFLRVSFGEFGNQDERSLEAILDHTYTISDLMNANPVTIKSTEKVRDAAAILAKRQFHSLPVVEGTKLVGIVTSSDLIQYLLDQY